MPDKVMVDVVYMRRLSALVAKITSEMIAAVFADMVWVFAHSCKLHACIDLTKFHDENLGFAQIFCYWLLYFWNSIDSADQPCND